MASSSLTARAAAYIENDVVSVSIEMCKAGVHARALKAGGVATLKTSIRESGYKRVHISIFFTFVYLPMSACPYIYSTTLECVPCYYATSNDVPYHMASPNRQYLSVRPHPCRK
jgi:hypothetical protein